MRLRKKIVPGGVAGISLLFAGWAGSLFEPFTKRVESQSLRPPFVELTRQQHVNEGPEGGTVDIPIAPLAPGQRIQAAIAVEPKQATPSKSVALFVKLRIAPGHYIYSMERTGKSSEPTSFEVNLPDGFSLAGPWRGPEPKRRTDGSKAYAGDVVFSNRLTASSDVRPGKHKVSIKVSFQMCNEAICWPAQKISRQLELEVTPKAPTK